MRYFHVRDGIIENCSLWDGKRPFNPGPDVRMIPEADLPGLHIGDRVPAPESESEAESPPEPEPESAESEPEPESAESEPEPESAESEPEPD